MSGIVGSYLNIRGSGLVGKVGTDGQVLTSTGAGLTQGFEAAPSGGITHADLYRVNANAALSDGTNVITANWEQCHTAGFGLGELTAAISDESSGVFSFAATGVYRITFRAVFGAESADVRDVSLRCQTTTDDGSNWVQHTDSRAHTTTHGNWTKNQAYASFYFDVTETTNSKVRFTMEMTASSIYLSALDDANQTCADFIRLAGT
jgi:hypothetical protein